MCVPIFGLCIIYKEKETSTDKDTALRVQVICGETSR